MNAVDSAFISAANAILATPLASFYTFGHRAATYDPTTGLESGVTNTSMNTKGTPPDTVGTREANGTTILTGDTSFYIKAQGLTLTPVLGDTVTQNSRLYRITHIDTVSGPSVPLLYHIFCRS